jgi:TPR repeat protein
MLLRIGRSSTLAFLLSVTSVGAGASGCAGEPPPPPVAPKVQAFTCPPGATWDGATCKTQHACEVEQPASATAAQQASACIGDADCEKQCADGVMKSCTDLAKKLDKKGTTEHVLELYKKACFGGDGDGCYKLGGAYQHGYGGLEKDRARSIELYKDACNCRSPEGCTDYGFGTQYGEGTAKDEAKAAVFYEKGCELGNAIGCKNIGWMYETGTGVVKDLDKAIAFYNRSCEAKHDNGCYNAAITYEHLPVPDLVKAAENYKKACEMGVAAACTNYGYAAEKGHGVDRADYNVAVDYYRKGCDKGNNYGCSNMGVMWEWGLGVGRKDVGKAMEFYDKACSMSLPLACEKKTKLIASLQTECDAQTATKPKPFDLKNVKGLAKVADAPPPNEGCTNLGYLYEHGTGLAKDERLAKDYYQKSCDAKLPIGCQNLGNVFDAGRVVPQDHKKAADLYKKSCDLGSSGGCNNLGLKYEYGTGVPKNETRALDLYKKACEKGSEIACNNVRYLAHRLELQKQRQPVEAQQAAGLRAVISHGAGSGASDGLRPVTAPH